MWLVLITPYMQVASFGAGVDFVAIFVVVQGGHILQGLLCSVRVRVAIMCADLCKALAREDIRNVD